LMASVAAARSADAHLVGHCGKGGIVTRKARTTLEQDDLSLNRFWIPKSGWFCAVLTGGLSCNRAAKQFGVGISTAINWVARVRETGSVAPGKMGGHKPKAISWEHRV